MTTPNLGLTEVPSNTLQPSAPVNTSLQVLDALIRPGGIVQDKDATTPPTTTSGDVGKRWIIPSGATGDWSGKAGQIALCTAATLWTYYAPTEGWRAYVLDEDSDYIYNGSAWTIVTSAFTGGSMTSAINEAKGADIASAATTDIGAATGNFVHVTGTTTITALGTAQAGTRRVVRFAGALTLTHNATSLILPTAANITTAADDIAVFVSEGSGNWRCVGYQRASGAALSGGGGGGGLTNWTEAVNTSAPNATIPVVSFTATNAASNVDAALLSKGTGALLASIPDSLATGGNKRGNYAVDWQFQRTSASHVASGNRSVIGGGYRNTASNTSATVAGGDQNTASGSESFVGGGSSNTASGQYANVPGGNSNMATAQASSVLWGTNNQATGLYSAASGLQATTRSVLGMRSFAYGSGKQDDRLLLKRSTTDATPSTLTVDGAAASTTNTFTIPATRAYCVNVKVVARNTSTGDSKSWKAEGTVKNISGTTSLVAAITPSVISEDAGAAAWTVAITADNALDCLKIEVTGAAATNIDWVAVVEGVGT